MLLCFSEYIYKLVSIIHFTAVAHSFFFFFNVCFENSNKKNNNIVNCFESQSVSVLLLFTE